jgi:2,3-bisphosphoglycerate-independent phosphoglycerate mutase
VVAVLVILDGASEPLHGGASTSLELARTPALDALAAEGALTRLRTLAPGLPVGSEAAIPALLGWMAPGPVDRAALEAAAQGLTPAAGERAWRIDVTDGPLAQAAEALRHGAPGHAVRELSDGRGLLLIGPPPLPAIAGAAGLRAWPEGSVPPQVLGPETVLVGAEGAAVGAARLMGAATVIPPGATGGPDSDLAAKARAALDALAAGAERVVVHVGGADLAGHARDAAAKVRTIERADRDVIAPLAAALRRVGGSLRVCPDHGCDPATGEHDGTPVPCLDWRPGAAAARDGARMTERAVAGMPVVALDAREAVPA